MVIQRLLRVNEKIKINFSRLHMYETFFVAHALLNKKKNLRLSHKLLFSLEIKKVFNEAKPLKLDWEILNF